MGHLCVPTSEHAKLIWEAHYSQVAGHFGVKKIVVVLQNNFIGQNFDRTSTSILDLALPAPFPSCPLRSKAYTPLFLFPISRGNPFPWITCLVCRPPSMEMTSCLWSLIGFRRWPSSQHVRRMSQRQILPISSSNEFRFTLGYHRPSSSIETTGYSTPFSRVSGLCWTPRSQNLLLSTPKLMAKPRLSI
jgi:hypothetical protein